MPFSQPRLKDEGQFATITLNGPDEIQRLVEDPCYRAPWALRLAEG